MLANTNTCHDNARPGPLIVDLDGLKLSAQERSLLKDPLIGGVIFFARNFKTTDQLSYLIGEIRSIRSGLLLCVDQEGGRVQRFKNGFSALPALGELQKLALDKELDVCMAVKMHARLMAHELRCLGLDFSFTPVVDIDYGHNEVVGDRSFGSDIAYVTRSAISYVQELKNAGMAAVGKHFPGHGFVINDTHIAVAVDDRKLGEIIDRDVRPFKALIDCGVAGIMPAHVIYSDVDDNPAGQSIQWIQHILRGLLGFKGAVISDDLGMAGAAGAAGAGSKAVKAIAAGCDLVMVCNNRAALNQTLQALHQMDTDHLASSVCLRRSLLRAGATSQAPVGFTIDEARDILCG